MTDKIKVECVHKCGGSLVNTRHVLDKSAEKGVKAIDQTIAELEASMPEMKKHGWRKMQYATALRKLNEARAALISAPLLVMEAHDSLRGHLAACNIAEPTDEELVPIIGFANFR
jgi:hypothetical protein